MLAYLSAFLPIAGYLILMRAFDAFSMIRWRGILQWLGWGVFSALFICGIVHLVQCLLGGRWTATWISPMLEECIKLAPLAFYVFRRRVAFLVESLLYGEAIGAGFALVENVLYLNAFPNMTVGTALVRGLGTSLMHMGCTAFAASLLLAVMMVMAQKYKNRVDGVTFIVITFLNAIPSMAIHFFYNTMDAEPMMQVIVLLVAFFLLFYLLSIINERLIIRWLDNSMFDDICLVAALREGRLVESRAGQYLSSLRDRFEPLVFFDMTAYVLLYVQLVIMAKSQIMLHDAGLSTEFGEEQRSQLRSQLTELQTLHQRIPHMGHAVLRPLLHTSEQNHWALQQLWKM